MNITIQELDLLNKCNTKEEQNKTCNQIKRNHFDFRMLLFVTQAFFLAILDLSSFQFFVFYPNSMLRQRQLQEADIVLVDDIYFQTESLLVTTSLVPKYTHLSRLRV